MIVEVIIREIRTVYGGASGMCLLGALAGLEMRVT